MKKSLSRRQFVKGASGAALLSVGEGVNANAAEKPQQELKTLTGTDVELVIAEQVVNFTGQQCIATTVNGSLPAPTLRFTEGDTVRIRVTNHLSVPTSIHWHGLLVPYQMDGVPGISFAGIAAGESFVYTFTLRQHGTYWYHAHSGFQEQTGLFGAIVIEPKQRIDVVKVDREHVVLLSDWTDLDPRVLLAKLKKNSAFDNQHQPTLLQFYKDTQRYGLKPAITMRKMWQKMRMSPTDFSDLSAGSFTYLLNGQTAANQWTGVFRIGERVLLRLINGSAQTIFDVRIPNLKLTIVAADGQAVKPVTVDEFRIAPAETYDVLVTPKHDAYCLFAQNIDRTGYVTAALATRVGLRTVTPKIDPVQWLTMTDMMGNMHADMSSAEMDMSGMDHTMMGHEMPATSSSAHHAITERNNPFVDTQVDQPRKNLDDAGVNLRNNGRRILTYADLQSLTRPTDLRAPTRTIEMHLTGSMLRYVWGFDGQTFAESKPVHLSPNERVRIVLVNDTMMTHPMHLHGMWSDLVNEAGEFQVRKHTIMVQPAQQISFDVTAIEGRWAFHCHLMYHMDSGMFREVVVD